MAINIKTETIVQTESGNTVYELANQYISKTINAEYAGNKLAVTEIGDKYIQVDNVLPVGDSISITYKYISNDVMVDGSTVFNDNGVLNRLRDLEQKVIDQQLVIEKLLVAVDQRLSKQTFNLWTTAIENNLGRTILPSSLDSIQSFQYIK